MCVCVCLCSSSVYVPTAITVITMACLQKLRQDVGTLESLFPKDHERFQVSLTGISVWVALKSCLSVTGFLESASEIFIRHIANFWKI